MTDKLYVTAVKLRAEADKTGDPELYRKAAADFRELNMGLAAERCDHRAQYLEARNIIEGLLQVEWSTASGGETYCSHCLGLKYNGGHRKDCIREVAKVWLVS